ncbi:uncharacterized protein At4g14100-like [Phalaenopsis equestris]|uniref:uncharacterized protein At4g14100-like n=1 Tax=Phalaenopsis equestris TaxID=78828 RepID=UPI0009E2C523|nr:uncharacterized protein At4g14100-like [Phalaenopsis equestris]
MRLIIPLLFLFVLNNATTIDHHEDPAPTPAMWPERFHALLYMNLSSTKLQLSDLWYDWPRGLNLNLMQKQLGPLLHDVEWNNGTSFYFTLTGREEYCRVVEFGVGIPRPDFLAGATYLGRRRTDGFLCNLWEKIGFIWYYEDVVSHRPVRWDFYDGISTHVMTFEVGAVLEKPRLWQAPAYCFSGGGGGGEVSVEKWTKNGDGHSLRKLISRF